MILPFFYFFKSGVWALGIEADKYHERLATLISTKRGIPYYPTVLLSHTSDANSVFLYLKQF